MRIVIIGNGDGVLKSEKRKFIDDSDIVIRINNFRISGYEDFVGTKFDIYSCSLTHLATIDIETEEERLQKSTHLKKYKVYSDYIFGNPLTSEEIQKVKDVLVAPKIRSGDLKMILVLSLTDKNSVSHYPFSDKVVVRDFDVDANYSTGFRTILYCLKHFEQHEVFISGFDSCLSSGWYWDKTPWGLQHVPVKPVKPVDGPVHPYVLERIRLNELIQNGIVKTV